MSINNWNMISRNFETNYRNSKEKRNKCRVTNGTDQLSMAISCGDHMWNSDLFLLSFNNVGNDNNNGNNKNNAQKNKNKMYRSD